MRRHEKKPWKRSRRHCRKCGVDTCDIREYYSLHNEVWQAVVDRWKIPADERGQTGMICIGCFEKLLGRQLTSQDFKDVEVNRLEWPWNIKSDRLCERIHGPNWRDKLSAILEKLEDVSIQLDRAWAEQANATSAIAPAAPHAP